MKKSPLRIVILGSGRGSNAQALINFSKKNPKLVKVLAVISDKAEAQILIRAKNTKIPAYFIPHDEEQKLLRLLQELKPAWTCLAGYMRILSPQFLQFFADSDLGFFKVMNIHPALLPAFSGLRAYERAFSAGIKIAGVTVHLVDEGVDTGKVILQACFARKEKDTFAEFQKRGLTLEHKLYVKALALAAKGKIRLKKIAGTQDTMVSTA